MANTGNNTLTALAVLTLASAIWANTPVARTATNVPDIRFMLTEEIKPYLAGSTNVTGVSYGTRVMNDELIVADYFEYKERETPLWRRNEAVFLIALPFSVVYSYLSLALVDSGDLLNLNVPYLKNNGKMSVASTLFYAITAVIWSAAITVDDNKLYHESKRKVTSTAITLPVWHAAAAPDASDGFAVSFHYRF
ncbi:MAG: hypothetical protein HZC28_10880 [Spirochaetes bacterium]|nr:hypothetical protein [Spirochaetota bacterium]